MQKLDIYMNKVVISFWVSLCLPVCLFVCSIITPEPLYRFVSNFVCGNRETHGNVFSLILIFKVKQINFDSENLFSW